MRWTMVAVLSVGMVGATMPVRAQEAGGPGGGGGGRGQFSNMPRVAGEVTAVSGASVTVKSEDGTTYTVVTTDNTRVMKGNGQARGAGNMQTIKVADLKTGDGLIAMGQLDAPAKTLHAAFVVATDASVVKAMKENLGKTYITGKVTAIDLDNAKLTVTRPDGVSQVIGLDENTSFKRGRGRMGAGNGLGTGGPAPAGGAGGESITLADVKVGDQVQGQGAVKAGTFVPTELHVMSPRPKPAE